MEIEPDDINSLVKLNFDKYDYKYNNRPDNIIESLRNEINSQKDQLDYMINKIFNVNKNYRKVVSIDFNEKFMKHIGAEVYKKYPNRIKLLENAIIQIERKNNEIKEKDKIILYQNLTFKIIFMINLVIQLILYIFR